jgi:DNA-directed RNA polymerase subunit RPC12/RpoP
VLFLSIGQVLGDSNPIQRKQKNQRISCPNCKSVVNKSDRYCQNCGNDLTKSIFNNKCPKCGTESVEGSKFCSNCGTNLIDGKKTIRSNVCPSCNHQLQGNEKFCDECGYKIV